MKDFSIKEIADVFNGELVGNGEAKIVGIAGLGNANKGEISFLSDIKYLNQLQSTTASAVFIEKSFEPLTGLDVPLIKVDDPYTCFMTLAESYSRKDNQVKIGLESPCHVDKSVRYGDECYIGAFSYIDRDVIIGDHVKILPNCYIGPNVKISDHTILHAGVKIYADTIIGKYCTIQSGAVIGSDGFGFRKSKDGTYENIPHFGNVILEDHVSIGANTVIDAGTFDSTLIKEGVKLDNLIQIAHNVEIGANTVMAAQSGIAGSSVIGSQCIIGGQAGIVGHIQLPNATQVQAQSGVTQANEYSPKLYGSPALPYTNYLRSYAVFKRLPELLKKLSELETRLNQS